MAGDRAPTPPGNDGPERTEDGHYIVVKGRRWRATDPAVPDTLRRELTAELMRARRAVGAGHEHARSWVQDAKVALGERGEPWWQQPSPEGRRQRAACAVRALLRHREGKTICPSDVARIVGGASWRELMAEVREVAGELATEGVCEILQKGRVVDLRTARGPVRLAAGERLTGVPGPSRPGPQGRR